MAGILDSKTRILDTVVTELGRRQISSGKMKIEFASLTDTHAYYEADAVSGSSDATARIYFESPGARKQDLITFETDDSGKLLGFPSDHTLTISGDEIFQKDAGTSPAFTFVSSSSTFASLSAGMITSSIDNFKNLHSIGSINSPDTSALNKDFKLSANSANFVILNTHPFVSGAHNSIATIDSIQPLFMDKRLSHVPNFKFLPPMKVEPVGSSFEYERAIAREASVDINSDSSRKEIAMAHLHARERLFLAEYTPLSAAGLSSEGYTYFDLLRELNGPDMNDPDWASDVYSQAELLGINSGIERKYSEQDGTAFGQDTSVINVTGGEIERDRKSIFFAETSPENNLVMQIFEINSGQATFKKLDVIDFGEFNSSVDPVRPHKHVFFAGKVYEDSVGTPRFVNLFTIVLD
jgi:hypothetical protein